jgi:hypothetical protein
LQQLNQVFRNAEEYRSSSKLALIFYIYKGLMGLNDRRLVEHILRDDRYLDTFGILERKVTVSHRLI